MASSYRLYISMSAGLSVFCTIYLFEIGNYILNLSFTFKLFANFIIIVSSFANPVCRSSMAIYAKVNSGGGPTNISTNSSIKYIVF